MLRKALTLLAWTALGVAAGFAIGFAFGALSTLSIAYQVFSWSAALNATLIPMAICGGLGFVFGGYKAITGGDIGISASAMSKEHNKKEIGDINIANAMERTAERQAEIDHINNIHSINNSNNIKNTQPDRDLSSDFDLFDSKRTSIDHGIEDKERNNNNLNNGRDDAFFRRESF